MEHIDIYSNFSHCLQGYDKIVSGHSVKQFQSCSKKTQFLSEMLGWLNRRVPPWGIINICPAENFSSHCFQAATYLVFHHHKKPCWLLQGTGLGPPMTVKGCSSGKE